MLKVKNWSSYQHYKHRNPPWIKLSTSIFQEYDFFAMSDASKLLAICILTLASRYKDPQAGIVPDNLDWIKSQCGLGKSVTEENLQELENKGFIERASKMLASCKQSAMPETEPYSKETETESILVAKAKIIKPEEIPEQVWGDFLKLRKNKRAPVTQTALNGIKNQARLAGVSFSEALEICCQNGWAGFKAEWIINQQKGTKNGKSKLKAEADELLEQIRAGKFVEGFDGID